MISYHKWCVGVGVGVGVRGGRGGSGGDGADSAITKTCLSVSTHACNELIQKTGRCQLD